MAEKKKSHVLFDNHLESALKYLDAEKFKTLFSCLFQFYQTRQKEELDDAALNILFDQMCQAEEESDRKYREKVERLKDNKTKGKNKDNDNVNENVNVIVNDNVSTGRNQHDFSLISDRKEKSYVKIIFDDVPFCDKSDIRFEDLISWFNGSFEVANTFAQYIQYRNDSGFPFTSVDAVRREVDKLNTTAKRDSTKIAWLERIIERNWKGVWTLPDDLTEEDQKEEVQYWHGVKLQ